MKAVRWIAPRKISVDEVPDPTLREPTDAIIKVTATAICGSDLHLYDHGASLAMKPGDIVGHEAMGIVEEVGTEVAHIAPGDTVVVPFNISCGHCFMCGKGLYSQCELTQSLGGKKGASLFGYTHMYGGIPGGQAEYLRVPMAHFGPICLDDAVPELAGLLLSDVLPTAWQAVVYADVEPGSTVVVFGLGPIGQMASRIALHRGAGRVIGVDMVAERLQMAARHGVEPLDSSQFDAAGDVTAAIEQLTKGRGADSVIEAVGMDSSGSAPDRVLQTLKVQPDRLTSLRQALGSVRRGGTVSVTGVYTTWFPNFPLGDLFDKQITLRWGQANVRRWTAEILDTLRAGDPLDAAGLVTNQAPLSSAPMMYEAFKRKENGVVKVVLRPW
jgi:threonine dehydrogenase-like Zn-dependent dehydrogenase